MKLLFKQRVFSWLDSYDIYDENERPVFRVKSKLSWGHLLKIYDRFDREVGTVKQKVITILPKFELYEGTRLLGTINKELAFFKHCYSFDYNGWTAEGDIMAWDYQILDVSGELVATVSKELFHIGDTYTLDIVEDENALQVLMFVLAIDAEKCSKS